MLGGSEPPRTTCWVRGRTPFSYPPAAAHRTQGAGMISRMHPVFLCALSYAKYVRRRFRSKPPGGPHG
eukprot:1753892-Prymnesium_polylepis.1